VTQGPVELNAVLQSSDQVSEQLRVRAQRRTGFQQQYPFESRWFRTDDGVQHYVDEGSGPPLLMVHGNPTWSFAWRHLIAGLRDRYRVIAVDHLGCGFSEKPQETSLYVLDRHIARLTALVQALGLQNVCLFGHDWGGAIGMGCAGRLPDRFSRFVLMNTGAFRSQAIPFRIALCRIPLLGQLGDQGLNLFVRAALWMAVERPLSEAARAGLLAPYDSWSQRIAVHQFVQDIPLHAGHRSYAALSEVERGLAQFRDRPIQLIWGMRDWCFTPHEFLEGFLRYFPEARAERLAEAGHYVFEDAQEQVLSTSRQFLLSTDGAV
jgi:haloalkane dehalogenase